MKEVLILIGAAGLEVGGDALVRWGIRGGQNIGFVLGAVVLFAYGLLVNLPKWDFGRLLGVYIALFFVVSQIVAYFFFHEKVKTPMEGACICPAFIMRFVQEHGAQSILAAYCVARHQDAYVLDYLLRCHKGSFYRSRYPMLSVVE
jgi:small multidrug resistance family-3 protein